jgi:hypothetical protein
LIAFAVKDFQLCRISERSIPATGTTSTWFPAIAKLEGTGDNLQQGLCAKVAKGKDLVAIARAMAKQLIDQQDNFAISADAVKRQARVFKSVLKLDTNFHLYIHGDREKIERGVDESGRKSDKIYYEQEL